MLRLKNITKDYQVAGASIRVLKGLNISFRKNEFVSILGPSGCGKTTTLNIIGGLDKYTSGDLIICGKSTKSFSSRDWDIYRNQRIGFIFQSYNLIPHQTILGNVELALTISGISKEERQKRAKTALDKVGLKGEYNKKPNQLSGGQCQRVAIARALVNEPEILLADEPTGALDTKTSIQIMDLIKEIAKERLVIMVTHNPELAEKYSTRIVRLVDGEITEDTNPFLEEEEILECENIPLEEKEKKSKAKMSWWTAFKLSARNLFSKKNRSIMTCIACSIGIIGVSSVLSVSNGVKSYINSMQDDMLSGNPIVVQETTYDYESLLNGMNNSKKAEIIKENGYINVDSMVEYLVNTYGNMESATIKNDIKEEYINYVKNMPKEYYAAIDFDYGLDVTNNIYTNYKIDNNHEVTPYSLSTIKNIYISLLNQTSFASYSTLVTSISDVMAQSLDNEEYILSQYDLKKGKIAKDENEIMVVLDSNSSLTDVVLAELGYYTQEEFLNVIFKATSEGTYDENLDKNRFNYDEIMKKEFTYYDNNTIYKKSNLVQTIPFTYNTSSKDFAAEKGKTLKVVGILEPKSNISYGSLKAGFYYTKEFSKNFLNSNKESEIVNYMNENNVTQINGAMANGTPISGVVGSYSYYYDGETKYNVPMIVGDSPSSLSSMVGATIGGMMGGTGTESTPSGSGISSDVQYYFLSSRNVGGNDIANKISIYPVNFKMKDKVRNYLDVWNSDKDIEVNDVTYTAEQRKEIKYTDTLTIVINMINTMIDIVTTALISFTALSLVVSCVMIAIITYVSVVERIKEIGVIRSLGGRKRDVSNLFNAETIMLGTASGLFGVLFTYLLTLIVDLTVGLMIGYPIAQLRVSDALIMILLSLVLTVLSGLIPASKAAHQDPVNALRSE